MWDVGTRATVYSGPAGGRVVAFSPDGARFATLPEGKEDGEVPPSDLCVWEIGPRGLWAVSHIPARAAAGTSFHAAFSPNGRTLVVNVGLDGTGAQLTLYDAGTGKSTGKVPFPGWKPADPPLQFLFPSFSPDARFLFAADRLDRVHGYDLKDSEARPPLAGHLDHLAGLAVSPDGRRVYTAGDDKVVRRWDTAAWAEVPPPPG